MHPRIAPLGFLVGTWQGEGRGEYPTIEPFTYTEEAVFAAPPDKPFLSYTQRTSGADGQPLHAETGYLRLTQDGIVEAVIAQPTGIVEVLTGRLEGTSVGLTSTTVGLAPTALPVTAVERRLAVDGEILSYVLDLAYREIPLTLHLEAVLERRNSQEA